MAAGPRRLLLALLAVSVVGVLFSLPATASAGTEETVHAGFASLLPPLTAIVLALVLKDVLVALVAAVYLGALLVHADPLVAFARLVDGYVVDALADADHAAILVFSALLAAMVGVMAKSGGTLAIVDRLAKAATDRRRGQVATWCMGLLIFFDDYANTLIVGPTMRPVTDRLKISREKLAYIVDSTAAPVVSLIPISTWIGFEIGLVQEALEGIGSTRQAFGTIVASIPYRFYQFFALGLGLLVAWTGRDLGAMVGAERRALGGRVLDEGHVVLADFEQEAFEPPPGRPRRALDAALPVVTVVVTLLVGLWITGSASLGDDAGSGFERLRNVFAGADSYKALLWASLLGVVVAMTLSVGRRTLRLAEATEGAIAGLRAPLVAFVVLILAWSLGDVCDDLGTAAYVVELTAGQVAPALIPALVFLLAAAIAFATGTSWGTMAILTPMVVPMAHSASLAADLTVSSATYETILLATVASVLAGAVWGDHCSPIADTTILASMAASSDHMAHVRTQIPYALVAGSVAVLVGILPSSFGLSPWIGIAVGLGVLTAIVLRWGRPAG